MNTWKSALVGSFRDITQMLALPPSLLPPALPSSLLSDGYPGEAEIMGALRLCASQVSFSLQKAHKPSLHKVKPGLLWSLHFFCGIPFRLVSKEPQELTHPPRPKTAPATVVFHKTDLFQEDYHDQSKVTVLSYRFNFKISIRWRRLAEAWRPRLLTGKPALHQRLHRACSRKAALFSLLPRNTT